MLTRRQLFYTSLIAPLVASLATTQTTPPLRTLKEQWEVEVAQDLLVYHSIDAEEELAHIRAKMKDIEAEAIAIEKLRRGQPSVLRMSPMKSYRKS